MKNERDESRRNGVLVGGGRAQMFLLIALCASSFGCQLVGKTSPTTNTAPAATVAAQQTPEFAARRVPEKAPMAFPPRLEAALKKVINARIDAWRASIEARDIDRHLQFYADGLESYYLQQNVVQDVVRADRARAFAQFEQMKVQLINIDIQLQSTDDATVVFDKTWDFKKEAAFSNGLVQQEMKWRRIDKRWTIVSEKDLQIYRYHNG